MKEELIIRFNHFWKTFSCMIDDISDSTWKDSGYNLTKPDRLAFHIIQSVKYYIQNTENIILKSGISLNDSADLMKIKTLPTKQEIKTLILFIKEKTEEWILKLDLEEENKDFVWTGKTKMSIVFFMLTHSQFHLGEMNSLLNEQEKGNAKDYWATL